RKARKGVGWASVWASAGRTGHPLRSVGTRPADAKMKRSSGRFQRGSRLPALAALQIGFHVLDPVAYVPALSQDEGDARRLLVPPGVQAARADAQELRQLLLGHELAARDDAGEAVFDLLGQKLPLVGAI